MINKIILASKSPRRKEILEKAGYNFYLEPSSAEYDIVGKNFDEKLLYKCVKSKYDDIKNIVEEKYGKDCIVISSDTVVVANNIIIGKPKDKNNAIEILKDLSGKTHFVATGVLLVKNEKEVFDFEKTYVTFRKLGDEDIEKYLEQEKPYDKAGAYGIQDKTFDFAIKVEGNIDNVIGFPINTFNKCLKLFGHL